jgi:hypothetical protein
MKNKTVFLAMACIFGILCNVFIAKGSDGQVIQQTIAAPSLKNYIIEVGRLS